MVDGRDQGEGRTGSRLNAVGSTFFFCRAGLQRAIWAERVFAAKTNTLPPNTRMVKGEATRFFANGSRFEKGGTC
jgi:hypothetical protein